MNKITWRDRVINNSLYLSDKILKIADVYKLELGKFVFKYHIRALPEISNNYFLLLEQIHNYDRRTITKKAMSFLAYLREVMTTSSCWVRG